jgi:hypothetical protein
MSSTKSLVHSTGNVANECRGFFPAASVGPLFNHAASLADGVATALVGALWPH